MLIKNVHVTDPFSGTNALHDVVVQGDRIVGLFAPNTQREEDMVIDGTGLFLLPGFMDVHVHFRDPGFTYKEDIFSGAEAAARGGFTRVVLMANTNPVVDNEDTLEYVLENGAETDIDVMSVASVTKGLEGRELTDFDTLYEKGAVGFSDDGIPIMDEKVLKEALFRAKLLGVPISLHEEDKSLISENGINAGKASEHFGIKGSPREAEISLVSRDVKLAISSGAKINIQHISAAESVDIIRKAQKENPDIYAEATPHHIALTEEATIEYGANAKMNPPLRTEADRRAIIEGIKDGTIKIIATDHAPHSREEKAQEITKAPSGITGLETAFSVAYDALVKPGHITLYELAKLLSMNPSRMYGLEDRPVKSGGQADFVLVKIGEDKPFLNTLSKSENTPFLGKTFSAGVIMTICKGKIIYEEV